MHACSKLKQKEARAYLKKYRHNTYSAQGVHMWMPTRSHDRVNDAVSCTGARACFCVPCSQLCNAVASAQDRSVSIGRRAVKPPHRRTPVPLKRCGVISHERIASVVAASCSKLSRVRPARTAAATNCFISLVCAAAAAFLVAASSFSANLWADTTQ